MGPPDWAATARVISKSYYDYDGFVVIMGTDTMAYAASGLSFMLENLGKPVIFTGSMVPLCELYNDAKRNLIVACIVAGYVDIPEVCLFMNSTVFRGNRVTKVRSPRVPSDGTGSSFVVVVQVDSHGLDAFDSPNFPSVIKLATGFRVNSRLFRPQPRARFRIAT
jgi:L-asparaginase